MATVRLHFPENEAPTLLNLTGPRITVGRLPHNTLQIIDRTISALHAEFIREGDHFRLHDRGSVNGTFVNGERVMDYHLKDACKISFGTFECEFSPAIAPADLEASSEALPSRGEINEVRHENAKLRNQVELLRDEVETLRKAPMGAGGEESGAVPKEEFVRIVGEMEKLREALQNASGDVKRLKSDLAVLQRDRGNLQRALDSAKREMAEREMRPVPIQLEGSERNLPSDSEPDASLQDESTAEEIMDAFPEQESVEAVPSEAPLPEPPPFQKLPKPAAAPGKLFVPTKTPASPTPSIAQPQRLAPAALAKTQPVAGSGLRPFTKGNPPAPQGKPVTASSGGAAAPAPSAIRPPAPSMAKPFQKIIPKPPTATAAGPKGTQKISVHSPER